MGGLVGGQEPVVRSSKFESLDLVVAAQAVSGRAKPRRCATSASRRVSRIRFGCYGSGLAWPKARRRAGRPRRSRPAFAERTLISRKTRPVNLPVGVPYTDTVSGRQLRPNDPK